MKCSMTVQEKVTFIYKWLRNRGYHIGRFDYAFLWNKMQNMQFHIVRIVSRIDGIVILLYFTVRLSWHVMFIFYHTVAMIQ